MKQKIVVSNVRFPYEDWMIVRSSAASMGMSINEYFQYLSNVDQIKRMTGTKKITAKAKGYQALRDLIEFAKTHKGKPKGANEDDKIIYDIE